MTMSHGQILITFSQLPYLRFGGTWRDICIFDDVLEVSLRYRRDVGFHSNVLEFIWRHLIKATLKIYEMLGHVQFYDESFVEQSFLQCISVAQDLEENASNDDN